ncbi:MAG TPA: hypothetical protein VMF31_10695 [Solirubrobacterales bacterium]|nr:hypothetical protein [Solirubrobacterales bacterium]
MSDEHEPRCSTCKDLGVIPVEFEGLKVKPCHDCDQAPPEALKAEEATETEGGDHEPAG